MLSKRNLKIFVPFDTLPVIQLLHYCLTSTAPTQCSQLRWIMPSLVWLLLEGIAMLLTVPCKGQRCEIPKRNSPISPKTGTCIYNRCGRIYYWQFLYQETFFSRPRGFPWEFLVGVCHQLLQILTLFQTKTVIFHTRFQTWSLKSIPIFRPVL